MASFKNVKMTPEEYELYCQFLAQQNEEKKEERLQLESIKKETKLEISRCFEDETFSKLDLKFWRYPKGSIFQMQDTVGYVVKGVIRSEFNSEFLNYITAKNWVGTLKLSSALAKSWEEVQKNYKSNVQLVAHTDIILASIELNSTIVNMLKTDHKFKNTLLLDLVSIIRANDSLNYLLMHRNKVSIMATYLLWYLRNNESSIWKPIPTELSARLNFSLSDTRRSIDKLVQLGAIAEGEEFAPNTKKKYYRLNADTKTKLLEISGLKEHQIDNLARVLFDPLDDDC